MNYLDLEYYLHDEGYMWHWMIRKDGQILKNGYSLTDREAEEDAKIAIVMYKNFGD